MFILLAVIFITFLLLAYFNVSLQVWTVAAAIAVLILSNMSALQDTPILAILWTVFLPSAIILNVPTFRRLIVTGPAFAIFKRLLPPMSSTEKEALEAGSVWWDGDLFTGRPDWKKLLSFKRPVLTKEETAFIDGPVDDLCKMVDDWKVTSETNDLSPETWDFIKDNKFFGMIIPKEFGGLGFSPLAHSAVVQKVASRSTTAAVTIMVPNSLGPAELLLKYGTKDQKDYYLPRLASGKEVPCFGLTGPSAGSDAASTPDRGVVCKRTIDGKEVVGIRLDWEKRYITLGPIATVLGIAFKLYDPDHIIGDSEELGMTLALVPADTPGITIGDRHAPLDSAFQVGPNWGSDVFVTIESIIGGTERAGQGWRMLMDCLAEGRSISLPALSAGTSKLGARVVGAYSRVRKQFNMSIGKFEGVEEALAELAGYTYIIDSARILTAGAVCDGHKPSVASAIVKYHLTELARKSINHSMDIMGGAAICLGPRNLIGRIYQSMPISITVEGANILTRCMIIFGQGAIRCHPYVLKEMQAAQEKKTWRGLLEFDSAIGGHAGFATGNFAAAILFAFTGAHFVTVPGSPYTKKYLRRMTRMSAAFAFAADVTMLMLGGALKRKERVSARLGDALSHLYLASGVIKKFEDDGARSEDIALLDWSADYCLYKTQEALIDLFRNFPVPLVGPLMRLVVFPFGRPYSPPSDKLGHKVASIITSPGKARERLTKGIYTSEDIEERTGLIEAALLAAVDAEAAEKKLSKAVKKGNVTGITTADRCASALKAGVLNEGETKLVTRAEELREEAIRVDHFPPNR